MSIILWSPTHPCCCRYCLRPVIPKSDVWRLPIEDSSGELVRDWWAGTSFILPGQETTPTAETIDCTSAVCGPWPHLIAEHDLTWWQEFSSGSLDNGATFEISSSCCPTRIYRREFVADHPGSRAADVLARFAALDGGFVQTGQHQWTRESVFSTQTLQLAPSIDPDDLLWRWTIRIDLRLRPRFAVDLDGNSVPCSVVVTVFETGPGIYSITTADGAAFFLNAVSYGATHVEHRYDRDERLFSQHATWETDSPNRDAPGSASIPFPRLPRSSSTIPGTLMFERG